jgi:hypothetical protein
MSLLKFLGRGVRLGFFVGLGAASALIEACSGSPARLDTSADQSKVKDVGSPAKEAGRRDAGADQARADAGPRRDGARWDIPLE